MSRKRCVCLAGCCAAGLLLLLKLPLAELVIAFAPGSVDAMMLLALALHLDPVYVGAHHVVRILFVGLAMPLLARHEALWLVLFVFGVCGLSWRPRRCFFL